MISQRKSKVLDRFRPGSDVKSYGFRPGGNLFRILILVFKRGDLDTKVYASLVNTCSGRIPGPVAGTPCNARCSETGGAEHRAVHGVPFRVSFRSPLVCCVSFKEDL